MALHRNARIKPTIVENRFHADTSVDHEIRAFCHENGIADQSFGRRHPIDRHYLDSAHGGRSRHLQLHARRAGLREGGVVVRAARMIPELVLDRLSLSLQQRDVRSILVISARSIQQAPG
jgi:hypothetical protein